MKKPKEVPEKAANEAKPMTEAKMLSETETSQTFEIGYKELEIFTDMKSTVIIPFI